MQFEASFQPSLTVLTEVDISQYATIIEIENDGPWDLWIAMGNAAPPPPQTGSPYPPIGNIGLYANVVRRYCTKAISVPQNNWQNRIWVLGVADPDNLATSTPFNAMQVTATTGYASRRNQCSVVSYTGSERPIAAFSSPRLTDLSGQPRIVTIPYALVQIPPAPFTTTYQALQFGKFAPPTAGNAVILWNAQPGTNPNPYHIAFYLYLYVFAPGLNATAGGMDFTLQYQVKHGGTVTTGPTDFWQDGMSWGANSGIQGPSRIILPQPIMLNLPLTGVANEEVDILLKNQGSANLTAGVNWTIYAYFDPSNTNSSRPGGIGDPISNLSSNPGLY